MDFQAVEAKAAKVKKVDIVADTKVQDIPKYPGKSGADEDEDEDERADMLPAEEHWEREALISTKSESAPLVIP